MFKSLRDNKTPLKLENIQHRIASWLKKPVKTEEDLADYLKLWWCVRYNKPLFHDSFDQYTLEELIYEYFLIYYKENPQEIDKFLNGGIDKQAKDDEEWYKKQMGNEYLSAEEQEKALKGTDVAQVPKYDYLPDEFKMTFDDVGDK